MEILTKENLVGAKIAPAAVSRTFTLTRFPWEGFTFSHPESDGKSSDVGVGGRIGILTISCREIIHVTVSLALLSMVLLAMCPSELDDMIAELIQKMLDMRPIAAHDRQFIPCNLCYVVTNNTIRGSQRNYRTITLKLIQSNFQYRPLRKCHLSNSKT